MRILRLEAANVKRLKAVRVEPDGAALVVVRGNNGAGKSSLLDSVRYLFGGARTHPPRVIRDGEHEAHVEAETEDFIALRTWNRTESGGERTELELRAKDGSKLKSPQAILDKLYSDNAFDPVAFLREKPDRQLDLLKKLVGVDTTEIDRAHAVLFEQRTGVNRDLVQAKARLAAMPLTKEPAPKVDVTSLLVRQRELAGQQQHVAKLTAERDADLRRVADCREAVKTAEQALAQARARLDGAEKQAAKTDNALDEAADACESSPAEMEKIRAQLSDAAEISASHERWAERRKTEKEAADFEGRSEAMTKQLGEIESKKESMITAAKFPVAGLSFTATGVRYKGLPLEQASSAEQLRVSVAVAVALNPKLRVMLVREGSLLDDSSLALLAQMAEEHGAQVWLEAVGENGAASVVISDGEVKS